VADDSGDLLLRSGFDRTCSGGGHAFKAVPLDLARVVGSSHVFHDYLWGSHSVAFESLGRELVRRIRATQARRTEETRCPAA